MSSDPKLPQKIKLRCKDGQVFEVSEAIIRESEVLNHAFTFGDGTDITEIPLNDISGSAFEKILPLLKCFENDPPYIVPESHSDRQRLPSDHPLFSHLKQLSKEDFEIVIDVADYLNTQRLIDCFADYIAHIMVGKNRNQIREAFYFQTEYTDKEEADIRARHQPL